MNKKEKEKEINYEITYQDNEIWYKIGNNNKNNIIKQINSEINKACRIGVRFFISIKLLMATNDIKYIYLMKNGGVKLGYYINSRFVKPLESEEPNIIRQISVDKLKTIFKKYKPKQHEPIQFIVIMEPQINIDKIYARYYMNKHVSLDMILFKTF